MIQKVKITRVVIQDKKKDGTPYKTTSGKPFLGELEFKQNKPVMSITQQTHSPKMTRQ
jgi:hypothetical protein